MALKKKLTKDEHSKLSADLQKEYEPAEGDEDSFVLSVEEDDDGGETPAALRRARDREKAEAKKWKKRAEEAETKVKEATKNDDKRKEKDIATLESEWQEKMTEKETELNTKLSSKDGFIRKSLINGKAMEIAAKISTVPTIMAKAIAERLTVEFEEDADPKLVVLDKHGKPSDLTLDKLQKEFVANPEFAAIIIASKGSGSAGKPADQRPGSAGSSDPQKPAVSLAKAPIKDLMAHMRSVIPEE